MLLADYTISSHIAAVLNLTVNCSTAGSVNQ